jgi:hypothetical protein
MPANTGMMLNDSLGDCTCAGAGHARQVWSFNATGTMLAVPDSAVLTLYEAMGYVPGNPQTDQGCVEQDVLTYWLQKGFDGNELTAFVEIDPANLQDVRQAIFDCGLVYIGIDVPAYLENGLTAPGSVWDVDPSADNSIVGGHCVLLVGYDSSAATFVVKSWGDTYTMTSAFFSARTDEVYGLVDADFIAATGQTPAGLTTLEWASQMQALQEQPT